MKACMGTNSAVKNVVTFAREGQLSVTVTDNEVVKVEDHNTLVYWAIRKDAKYWIVRYNPDYFGHN